MSTTNPSKKVLIVDDDTSVLNALKAALTKAGHQVEVAENGEAAAALLSQMQFGAIVSDIQMPASAVGGLDLLKNIQSGGSIPVILMTGFTNIVETEMAYKEGAYAFLAKPFKKEELLNLLAQIFDDGANQSTAEEPDAPESENAYTKLNIDDFIAGKKMKFNIYIKLSDSKFVKIAHEGEDIALERIQNYKTKGIDNLYLKENDYIQYIEMNLSILGAMQNASTISSHKKLAFLKSTQNIVMNQVFSKEMKTETFEQARVIAENTVNFLLKGAETSNLITTLNEHSNYLYAHSLGVSLYSVMIAKNLGWKSDATQYRLSVGGLLHDIGKKEIDPKIVEKPTKDLTQDEIKILESHPIRGAQILSGLSQIPGDISLIVVQHHERDTGNGYPSGLKKGKIHPLARVVAVADEFCKLVLKGPNGGGMSPSEALKIISKQEGLDDLSLEALKKCLETS